MWAIRFSSKIRTPGDVARAGGGNGQWAPVQEVIHDREIVDGEVP
jgi:hypothetical protein